MKNTWSSFRKKGRIKSKTYCKNLAKLRFPFWSFYRVTLYEILKVVFLQKDLQYFTVTTGTESNSQESFFFFFFKYAKEPIHKLSVSF